MKRRSFIKNIILASVAPAIISIERIMPVKQIVIAQPDELEKFLQKSVQVTLIHDYFIEVKDDVFVWSGDIKKGF